MTEPLRITRKQFRRALADIEQERRETANRRDGFIARIMLMSEEEALRDRYYRDREARKARRRRYAKKAQACLSFPFPTFFPLSMRDALRLELPDL